MSIFDYFIWYPDPEIFVIPGLDHPVRWYGLMFALGFLVAQRVLSFLYASDGRNEKDADTVTMYMLVSVIIGARLGHCLFYNPIHYLSNPIEIFKVWEGGLASHGSAIGMITGLYIYSRGKADQSFLWVLDRVAIVTLITGAFIRFGNFVNSEIIGTPTDSDYGVVFAYDAEKYFKRSDPRIESVKFSSLPSPDEAANTVPMKMTLEYKRGTTFDSINAQFYTQKFIPRTLSIGNISDHVIATSEDLNETKFYKSRGVQYIDVKVRGIARHPAQLYEALGCLLIFLVMMHIWYHHRSQIKDGFLFGVFMTLLWSERFIDEFFKENQEAWEATIPLNMGQWLSIPMFLIGVGFVIKYWGFSRKES